MFLLRRERGLHCYTTHIEGVLLMGGGLSLAVFPGLRYDVL